MVVNCTIIRRASEELLGTKTKVVLFEIYEADRPLKHMGKRIPIQVSKIDGIFHRSEGYVNFMYLIEKIPAVYVSATLIDQHLFSHEVRFLAFPETLEVSSVHKKIIDLIVLWHIENREIILIGEVERTQKVQVEDLILNETAHQVMEDARRFLEDKELYRKYNMPWKRSILLSGPPGTGKTAFTMYLANEFMRLRYPVFKIIHSRNVFGEDLDSYTRFVLLTKPAMVIVEDVDDLFDPARTARGEVTQLLDMIDEGIYIAMTTNHPERIHQSLIGRPGRIDMVAKFDLPNEEERRLYLSRLNMEKYTGLTREMSYATLKEFCFLVGTTNQNPADISKKLIEHQKMEWGKKRAGFVS